MAEALDTNQHREAERRLATLCRMTREMLDRMTPAQRDRMMQEHLAAARGPERNLRLLCEMSRFLFECRKQDQCDETKGASMATEPLIDLIRLVAGALESEGVSYAVTGSIASSIHGEPVTSLDVDMVTFMSPEQAARVAGRLAPRLYADADMVTRAAVERRMANFIDGSSGLKIDVSVLSDTAYHRGLMGRRIKIRTPDRRDAFWVVSPEDIVLMKLVWRKESRSEKQWRNALSVVRVRGHQLDWSYLRDWAGRLGVLEDLEALAREAKT